MSGFAFAAIYKDPIPPGPGPDGPDIPPIDPDDDPENINYTISGESIKPFVPFSVTVTGSSSKAKGNGGNLQADIDYEIRDGGEWASGKRTWELGTRVCDSSRTNAKFSWLIGGREPVTATLAYDAGTMTPDLAKDTLSLGETVGFTITYSHAQNCYATRFADFGASYWWEAQKNGTWERTNKIPVNQTPSFSNGVLSGNAYIGNLAGYDKIRLCVSYAGRNTVYAEASLVASDVTITLGADSLHCFGAATSLEIESDSLELMTAAFYRGDDTTEDITDTNGTPIAFSFSGTTWTGNIQAATAATAGTVVLKVFYNNEVVATKQINIATALFGEIEVESSSIMQGESIEATGTINGGDYTLTRLPAETVKLEVDSGALEYNEAGEDTIELSYTPVSSGTYTVLLVDTRDETILDQAIVEVASVYDALKEAIEERYKAKGSNTTVESYAMDIMAAHAINAMNGYVKGNIGSDGTYSEYNSSNTGITTSDYQGTENEWALDTYHKICNAVSRSVGPSRMYDSEYWKRKKKYVTKRGDLTKDQNDDVIAVEDTSSIISKALQEWESAQWEEDYDGDMKCRKEMLVTPSSYTNKNNYNRGEVTIHVDLYYQQNHYMLSVDGVIDFYMSGTPYVSGGNYDNCGHHLPSTAGVIQKTYSMNMSAGVEVLSDKLAGEDVTMTNIYSGNYQTIYGYIANVNKTIATYNFKHK